MFSLRHGRYAAALLTAAVLLTGCATTVPAETAPTERGSSPAPLRTSPVSTKPTTFDSTPTTAQEKEFDSAIRLSLGPDAGREFPNIYWGTKTYAGLRIVDDEVHVALKGWRRVPKKVLYGSGGSPAGLAMWFGNMAGDPQGIPQYTWVLVDARTGNAI